MMPPARPPGRPWPSLKKMAFRCHKLKIVQTPKGEYLSHRAQGPRREDAQNSGTPDSGRIAKIQFPKDHALEPRPFSICAPASLDCRSFRRQSRSVSAWRMSPHPISRRTSISRKIQNSGILSCDLCRNSCATNSVLVDPRGAPCANHSRDCSGKRKLAAGACWMIRIC